MLCNFANVYENENKRFDIKLFLLILLAHGAIAYKELRHEAYDIAVDRHAPHGHNQMIHEGRTVGEKAIRDQHHRTVRCVEDHLNLCLCREGQHFDGSVPVARAALRC